MANFDGARAERTEHAADAGVMAGAARPAATDADAARTRTIGWALPRPLAELAGA
jgi:hypothetical protein